MDVMAVGTWVFLSSVGLARVAGFAGRNAQGMPAPLQPGETPFFYVLEGRERTALIPLARAGELTRSLMTKDDAERSYARLCVAHTSATEWNESFIRRGQRVAGHGSAAEHIEMLHALYGLPGPLSMEQRRGLQTFEALVLPELAHVLGESEAKLTAELHACHPAAESLVAVRLSGA